MPEDPSFDDHAWDRRSLVVLAAVLLGAVVLCAVVVWRSRAGPASGALVPAVVGASPAAAMPGLAPASAPAEATAGPSPSESATVVVDVVGKVRSPGLIVLPAGSRVFDALSEAGGPRAGVNTSDQNLARVLVDGEQIRIGLDPTTAVQPAAPAAPTAPPGTPTDLNTATAAQLEALPGVGPVLAQRILDHRQATGGFTTVEQLMDVSGIGEATFADLQPFVVVR